MIFLVTFGWCKSDTASFFKILNSLPGILSLPLALFNMSANLENSAVATGLEKVSFHSSPKEQQCQRMLNLLYNCAHFTRQQGYAPSS